MKSRWGEGSQTRCLAPPHTERCVRESLESWRESASRAEERAKRAEAALELEQQGSEMLARALNVAREEAAEANKIMRSVSTADQLGGVAETALDEVKAKQEELASLSEAHEALQNEAEELRAEVEGLRNRVEYAEMALRRARASMFASNSESSSRMCLVSRPV